MRYFMNIAAVTIVVFLGVKELRAEESAGGILFQEVYAASPVAYQTVTVTSAGTISGMVKFTGQVTKETLPVTKDQSVCGSSKVSERLVVSATGGLKNTVVFLEDITKGKTLEPLAKNPVLDQVQCAYTPHIQLIPAGSTLEVVNSDQLLHNVHTYVDEKQTVFNYAMPLKGQKIPKKLTKAGILNTKCDAGHMWMNAFLIVQPHPYYALTNDEGNFTIKDVPPGTYTVKAWHEGWAVKVQKDAAGNVRDIQFGSPVVVEKKVTVAAGQVAKTDFEMK